jgi:ABC-2 type transport system permease protein
MRLNWRVLGGLFRIVRLELLWGMRIPESVVYNILGPVLLLLLLGPIRGGEKEYLDRLVPGLLAAVSASGAMHGIGAAVSYMRLYGSWRTLQASPIPTEVYFAGLLASRVVRIFGTCGLLVLAAVLAFGYEPRGNAFATVAFLLLGTLAFGAFGLVLSGLSSSPQAVSSTINLLFIPMLFVSGVFAETTMLWVQRASLLSPLTYLVRGVRWSLGGAGSPTSLAASTGVLVVWLVICSGLALALLRKRLEDA